MLLVLIQNFLHFQETGIYIKQILDINWGSKFRFDSIFNNKLSWFFSKIIKADAYRRDLRRPLACLDAVIGSARSHQPEEGR